MGVGGDRPLECFSCRLEVALAKGVHALAVGGGCLLDCLLHGRCLPAGGADGKVDE
jgi:hypothetical protein